MKIKEVFKMLRTWKKAVSLVLVLALSMMVCIPAFAATKVPQTTQSVLSPQYSTGVTKFVKTSSNSFDLYLSNADTNTLVLTGTFAAPVLGVIPPAYVSVLLGLIAAFDLYQIDQANMGTGVVLHFREVNIAGAVFVEYLGATTQPVPIK